FQFDRVDFGLLHLVQCILNAGKQAGLIERLLDEIERTDLDSSDSHIDVPVASDQDDRGSQTRALEVLNQIEAGHSGHADIRNNTVKPLSAPGCRQKVLRGCKTGRFNILTGEIEAQRVEHRLVVVNDRNVSENAHAWAVFAMGSVK